MGLPTLFRSSLLLLTVFSASSTAAEPTTESQYLAEIARASNQSLLWGPYRPNLYFGVKPRIPQSFSAGLLWASVNDFETVQNNFRYSCEQGDDMAGYGWEEYDVRTGGRQVIHDQHNKVDITTEFVKVEGGENGGHWGVRIKGTPREDAAKDHKTTVIFAVSAEGEGRVELVNKEDPRGLKGDVVLEGEFPQLGEFKLEVTRGPDTNRYPSKAHKQAFKEQPTDRTIYTSVMMPVKDLWQTKAILFQNMRDKIMGLTQKYGAEQHPPPWQTFLLPTKFGPGNVHFIQKVFEGPFEFDVLYTSKSAPEPMTSAILTEKIEANHEAFVARFDKIFKRQAPFDAEKYKKFAHNFFSNLLGGIGYFHGTSIVDRTYADEYLEEDEGFWEEAQAAQKRPGAAQEEGPYELFTSIPSRPFFPRGFLWDEGFHLLSVSEWDMDLTLSIVKSWFNLIDADGWIAREQILGDEARSKVPAEFQVQYPHYANPPTLFFILTKFIDKFTSAHPTGSPATADFSTITSDQLPSIHLTSAEVAVQYLKDLYPLLKRHYDWFRRTQSGEIRAFDREAFSSREAYRWRGRTPSHTLTSGLDDYPRAQPPHTGELHVDLISWVGLMTRLIKRIAVTINEVDDAREYERIEHAIIRNIDDLHWSEQHQTYCDATIDAFEDHTHVCHKGYISLFPALLGLLPADHPHLPKILDLIESPDHLWTPYGLRSLSKSDPEFATGENYWKGPVWININYLAITRLAEYAATPGPQQERAARLYKDLRRNVVENVFRQWETTGYAWEQYDEATGKGQRTAHFLGWTSLVVEVMGMPEEIVEAGAAAAAAAAQERAQESAEREIVLERVPKKGKEEVVAEEAKEEVVEKIPEEVKEEIAESEEKGELPDEVADDEVPQDKVQEEIDSILEDVREAVEEALHEDDAATEDPAGKVSEEKVVPEQKDVHDEL